MNQSVESLFAEYLHRHDSGDRVPFDEFCHEHTGREEQLRRLKSDWDRLHALRKRVWGERLASVSVEPRAGRDGAAQEARRMYEELVARLNSRGNPAERLHVESEMDRGGMGTIYRVLDEDLHRTLAMKVLNEELAARQDNRTYFLLGRFLEEAQLTAQLDHPGIVPVHELGLDAQGRLFFTMKLIKGQTLQGIFELVASGLGGWNRTRALGVLLQVCQAMAYAHDKRVVHRDLKPANVMVGRYGEVFVMDWGLARLLDRDDARDLRILGADGSPSSVVDSDRRKHAAGDAFSPLYTVDGAIVGTPAYMSPEQATGNVDRIGPATDVYAVGAMLYQLLTGRMPYVRDAARSNSWTILARIQEGPPEPVHELAPDVPAEIVAVCEKAMARDPAERYATMADLAEDIRAFLEDRVVAAYRTGALAELRKWIVRNKAGAAAVAAVALSLVAAVGGLAVSRSIAIRAGEEVELASDFYELDFLLDQEDELHPATPDQVPAMDAWIDTARDFLERGDVHRARYELAEREDSPELGNRREVLSMLSTLEGADGETGLLRAVERRRELAASLRERTVESPEARERWNDAIDAIADSKICPHYGGLLIEPQLGLLPLRQDPGSLLWEFLHVASGERPVLHEDAWVIGEETGIVLVLLPGGTFTMGTPEDEAVFDLQGDPILPSDLERPAAEMTLEPFFLSKYEMTQGQWLRVEGENPAFFQAGNPFGDKPFGLTHPVEDVDPEDCLRVVARLALELPTEAQAEYAIRAGTTGAWSTGDDPRSIEGHANVLDRHAMENGGPPGWPFEVEIDDQWTATAPVGWYRPNDFGLHDTMGNVWEWTRDRFVPYTVPSEPGTGLRILGTVPPFATFVARGGAFYNRVPSLRSAYRFPIPGFRTAYGLRPARALDVGQSSSSPPSDR